MRIGAVNMEKVGEWLHSFQPNPPHQRFLDIYIHTTNGNDSNTGITPDSQIRTTSPINDI